MTSKSDVPIVVITPVRNEEWILERFLTVTSQFADLIIIADQHSTDASREICKKFGKVVILSNLDAGYNEASRQLLLIEKARELIPDPKVMLALDADEILAADAMSRPEWKAVLQAKPGTVLYFEKPDLYLSPRHCLRWRQNPFPLGYVDDGVTHHPTLINSTRIPTPNYAVRLVADGVKFLHYALANPSLQRAKMRFYSVTENVLGTNPWLRRRATYPRDWLEQFSKNMEPSESQWFAGWIERGIDMYTIPSISYSWHDFEVLRRFAEHGVRRFYGEDIWNFDWERCRQFAEQSNIPGVPTFRIAPPGPLRCLFGDAAVATYKPLRRLRSALQRWRAGRR